MDRRNFLKAAAAAAPVMIGWKSAFAAEPRWLRGEPVYEKGLVMENPADSGCVMYLDTGDFLEPGEWFAIPKNWCAFRVYPRRPDFGIAAQPAV